MTDKSASDPDGRELSRRLLMKRSAGALAASGLIGAGAGCGRAGQDAPAPASTEGGPTETAPPGGLIPEAPDVSAEDLEALRDKDGLRLLNDRPINAETPAHLLDDEVTPASRLFVRNNGHPPIVDETRTDDWPVEIAGESCGAPQRFTVRELRERFEVVSLQLTIECAGNGRSEFLPKASGNQWTTGAVGCPLWTGVRVRDVLEACSVGDDAVYLAYEGADIHLSGDSSKRPISRGVPIAKALEPESLLAFEMNGEPLPLMHGRPLRLVTGGWPASTCGKWIRRLLIRDRVHDGAKMNAPSYRVPRTPVAPGTEVPDEDMVIIGSMPVKSLITAPRSGARHRAGEPLPIRGHAWAGDLEVARVELSTDFGATWQQAALKPPVNRLAWQHFARDLRFDQPGYHEIWARATDSEGRSQPMVLPGWNPKGYLNNACHRVAVQIEA